MKSPRLVTVITPTEKARIERFLQSTYRGNSSELVRRLVFAHIEQWEKANGIAPIEIDELEAVS